MKKIRIEWASDWETPRSASHGLEGQELEQAKSILAAQLAPCGGGIAGKVLAKLKATMPGRNMTPTDIRMWSEVMLDDLAPLPADLVIEACDKWRKSERWLPTLSDLLGKMDPELTKRRLIYKALSDSVPVCPQISPSVPERVTADQVDAILAKHGAKPMGEDRDEKIKREWKHPKPGEQPKAGLSQAQLEAQAAGNQAEYWLKVMGER